MIGQKVFGLGRLEEQDRRLIEWEIDEIFQLRKKYTKLYNQVKWKKTLYPNADLTPLFDEWIFVADSMDYQYKMIFAWLCSVGKPEVWAELGYDLFQ